MIRKALLPFFFPGSLVLLAALAFRGWVASPETFSAFLRVFPYAVLVGGLFLGWRFHRDRLVLALLVLALADRALLHYTGGSGSAGSARLVFRSIALLLPLNLALLSLMSDRGLLRSRGLLRWGLILLQLSFVAWLYRYPRTSVGAALTQLLLKRGSSEWTPVGQLALLAFGVSFLVVVIRFLLRPHVLEAGFFWALVASYLGLQAGRGGSAPTFYFSTAGLILIFSLIETSYHLAYRDELTGLLGRRALHEAMLQLPDRYSVAMVDIDEFKKINDRYGHGVGDQVLRMVGSKLGTVSAGGKGFRYGGEEFVILFPGKSMKEVIPALESLRKAIEASGFTLRGRHRPRKRPESPKPSRTPPKSIPVTVSIGIAEPKNAHRLPEEVLRAADQALYRAKAAGRNRTAI
ncbi:MAG: GGDEF domain-containing protein [candidate division NC10 bacterium]|nr:GGDEF domain-containing protein [candidate division NC10 bacterium]